MKEKIYEKYEYAKLDDGYFTIYYDKLGMDKYKIYNFWELKEEELKKKIEKRNKKIDDILNG